MEICPGCKRKVRWYHRKGGLFNSSWHRNCAYAWNDGYRTDSHFAEKYLKRYDLPSYNDLYMLTQPQPQPESIGRRLEAEFREKYNIGADDKITIRFR